MGFGHPCQLQAPNPIPAAPACVMHVIRNSVNPAIICNAGVRTTRGLAPTNRGFPCYCGEKTLGTLGIQTAGLLVWAMRASIWGLGVQKSNHEHPDSVYLLCQTAIHAVHGTYLLFDHNRSPPFDDIYRRSTYQSCSRSSVLQP